MSRPHAPPPPDPPPRGLLLAAAAWVLVSLLVAYGLRPPVLPLASTYAPAARIALVTMLVGGLVGWPLLRLSQRTASRPITRTLLDLVALGGALQVTLWPLRLAAAWPIERTLAIDAWCVGWMLLAAAFPILGVLARSGTGRTLLMAGVLAATVGPILLAAWTPPSTPTSSILADGTTWWSPLGGLARLAAPGRLDLLPDERTASLAALAGGAAAFATATILATALRRDAADDALP